MFRNNFPTFPALNIFTESASASAASIPFRPAPTSFNFIILLFTYLAANFMYFMPLLSALTFATLSTAASIASATCRDVVNSAYVPNWKFTNGVSSKLSGKSASVTPTVPAAFFQNSIYYCLTAGTTCEKSVFLYVMYMYCFIESVT